MDDEIDEVARSMTMAPPPAALRSGVHARIAGRPGGSRVLHWSLGVAVAATVIVLAIVWPDREAPVDTPASRETVAGIVGLRASSRSVAGFNQGETNLHVDATPTLRSGKIQTRVVVFYRPNPTGSDPARRTEASVNLDFPIILEDGKRLVASQTTDPASDRRVTVEVMATILK